MFFLYYNVSLAFFPQIPKKTDFTTIPYDTVQEIQNKLNNRPRKSLGYKTPKEALLECTNGQKIALVT